LCDKTPNVGGYFPWRGNWSLISCQGAFEPTKTASGEH
jgi:hypothetical protein